MALGWVYSAKFHLSVNYSFKLLKALKLDPSPLPPFTKQIDLICKLPE